MNNFKKFTEKLKEHAIYNIDLSQFDNYFDNIKNDIETLKNFSNEMSNLKQLFSNLNVDDIIIKKIDETYYKVSFYSNIHFLISSIMSFYNEILMKNEKLIDKINNDFYNGSTLQLDFEIDVEPNNFNKMHFPINLPTNLKNIGIGKKIFLATINKIGYTIFSKYDSSIDANIIIYSIVNKSNDFYSFIKDEHIITFSSKMKISEIKNILLKWIKLTDYDNLILDKDFYDKNKDFILSDTILNNLYDDFYNKYNL